MTEAAASETPIGSFDEADPQGLRQELRREHERYIRTLADFDNYRKRVERDSEQVSSAGKRGLAEDLLQVVDDFERALAFVNADERGVADGIRTIRRHLLDVLASHGVTPFDSVGMEFDPAQHEAVGIIGSANYPSGTVAQELRRGYRWRHEVLRPAQVQVAA